MVWPPAVMRSSPDAEQAGLDALDDPECRHVLRKLELPHRATLVEEGTRTRVGGHHTNQRAIAFEAIQLALDEPRQLDVAVTRPAATADEQPVTSRSEVRRGR